MRYDVQSNLSLDDIPGVPQADVVVCVVERKTIFQILLGILADLKACKHLV